MIEILTFYVSMFDAIFIAQNMRYIYLAGFGDVVGTLFVAPSIQSSNSSMGMSINGPRREKTCLRGFRQSEIETFLLSY